MFKTLLSFFVPQPTPKARPVSRPEPAPAAKQQPPSLAAVAVVALHQKLGERRQQQAQQQPKRQPKRIAFEFIPRTQNFRNARSVLAYLAGNYKAWGGVRNTIEKRAGGKCVICGGIGGGKTATECHEVWRYEETSGLQYLKGLEALCPDCHAIKHLNRHMNAKGCDEFARLLARYAVMNGISEDAARADYCKALEAKARLDDTPLKLELSILQSSGFAGGPTVFDCHTDKFNLHIKGWKDAG